MKRKIAFVTANLSYGGGERIANMIIEEVKHRGHEVYVYTLFPEWKEVSDKLDRLRILRHTPAMGGKFKYLAEMTRLLREDRPDAVICIPLAYAELVVFAAKAARIPMITSERTDPWIAPVPGKERLHNAWRRLVYRMADGLVVQTSAVRDFFRDVAGDHTRVIHNPVIDDHLPDPLPVASRREIVAVGRLSEEKNFPMLVEAFSRLRPGHGYTLRIYGDGPLKAELESLIARLGLDGSVELMGRVDRVVDHLAGADILVLSSDNEGMPNALIEGLAMGLACISTDFRSGGARELIRHGENGLLVPTGDADALSEAIQRLVDDEALRLKLRRNAPKIRKTHSKELIIPQWVEFIENVIA